MEIGPGDRLFDANGVEIFNAKEANTDSGEVTWDMEGYVTDKDKPVEATATFAAPLEHMKASKTPGLAVSGALPSSSPVQQAAMQGFAGNTSSQATASAPQVNNPAFSKPGAGYQVPDFHKGQRPAAPTPKE